MAARCACLQGSADAHPAAQAWRPTGPPNRLHLIGQYIVQFSRYALCPLPVRRACCTQGRSPRGVGFSASPGPSTAVRLSPSSSLSPATLACGAWPSRRAGPSPRCTAGRTNPALASLTASPSLARFFAGNELRKDGGKQGPAQVSAPNQPKPQRAPNLGIRSALKPQGERACRYQHRESTPSFVFPFFVFFRPDKGQELSP